MKLAHVLVHMCFMISICNCRVKLFAEVPPWDVEALLVSCCIMLIDYGRENRHVQRLIKTDTKNRAIGLLLQLVLLSLTENSKNA